MSSSSLSSGRRAPNRTACARLAQRMSWMNGGEQPPMNMLMRTDKMASIKTSYVPSNIAGLAMLWPQELRDAISSCGLHGTMYIRPTNNVDRQHGLWLLNNLDPATLNMRFHDGQIRNLSHAATVETLGLNGGDREVPVTIHPSQREVLMRRVLRLMGEDEKKPGGLTVKFLKEFLEKPPPFTLTETYKTRVKVAYSALVISSYLAPRYSNPTVSDEAMYIVLNPDEIGKYDLAGYTLQVLREMAHRARVDQAAGTLTILAGGCLGLLEAFSFDWLEIPELEDTKYVSPRIAIYNGSFLRELIKRECYETGEGKVYGKALTRPMRRSPTSLQLGEGGSRSAVFGSNSVDRSTETSFGRTPTVHEFVSMVLADQNTRVSELFERVCHDYRVIDEQVEADRKRRRNEVNIAAGATDLGLSERLTSKYTGLLASIMAASGVVSANSDAGGLGASGSAPPVVALQAPPSSPVPVVGFVIPDSVALSLGGSYGGGGSGSAVPAGVVTSETGRRSTVPGLTALIEGGQDHAGSSAMGPPIGGVHVPPGVCTVTGAAQILRNMSGDWKGKGPALHEPGQSKVPVRRAPFNPNAGISINEPAPLAGRAVGDTLPIWDASGGHSVPALVQPVAAGRHISDLELTFMEGPAGAGDDGGYSFHPSILGLSHVTYPAQWVDEFYDLTTYAEDSELERRWYVSMDREEYGWSIIFTGRDFKEQMDNDSEITYHTMAASNRDTNLQDRSMYSNEEFPWGVMLEPDWATHFQYKPEGASSMYIDELLSARRVGYDISRTRMIMTAVNLRDSWSLYAFDMLERAIHVLDPLYQGASDNAYDIKHGDSCKCLLTGLRLCGDRHGYGWNIVESDWKVNYLNGLHPRSTHEDTGVYVFIYSTGFNGVGVPGLAEGLTARQLSYQRRKMVFQISISRANTGAVPAYLINGGW